MDIISIFAVMLVSLLVGGVTVTGILRHVSAWRESALAIAEGDFRARVNLPGSNEVLAANSAFNNMASRIQELERARTRFIQIAAHELRTPMTSINGICSILSDSLEVGASLPEAGKLAHILRQEMTHLSGLVSQILDSFLIQEGRFSLRMFEWISSMSQHAPRPQSWLPADPSGSTYRPMEAA
jgi:signal transduction histidine kinase